MRKSDMSFVFLLIFFSSYSSGTNQELQKQRTSVIGDSNTVKRITDTLSNYAIQIQGKRNFVSITSDNPGNESGKDSILNKLEVRGEDNSVTIIQEGKGKKVEVKQSGKGNQVNIVQKN